MRVETVTSLEHPDLWPYRTMRWSARHEEEGLFVAEGETVVGHVLRSPVRLVSLLLTERHWEGVRPLIEARPDRAEVMVYLADAARMDELTGIRLHQRLLACARIPDPEPMEQVLERSPRPWLWVAADHLANAENLGALIRNAAAFDVTGVLVGADCGPPWLRRVVRTSMGYIVSVPVLSCPSLAEGLLQLQARGVRCVAAHPSSGSLELDELDLRGDVCVVLGAEGGGLSPAVLKACPDHARIPMKAGFDSLNVVSASGIFLHHAARQQGRV